MDSSSESPRQNWDICPELDPTQQQSILSILQEYCDVFTVDPKRPNITHLAEHVIETGKLRPTKAKCIRVDKFTEL